MPFLNHQKTIFLGLLGSFFILLAGVGASNSLLSLFPLIGSMVCFAAAGLELPLPQVKIILISSLFIFLLGALGGDALEKILEPFFKIALPSLLLAVVVKKNYLPFPWASLGIGFFVCGMSLGSLLSVLPQVEGSFQQAFSGAISPQTIGTLVSLLPFLNSLAFIGISVACLFGAAALNRRFLGSAYHLPTFLSIPPLPQWYYWFTVAALSACFFPLAPVVFLNIAFFSFIPFFLLGLEVIHLGLRRLPSPQIAFISFYVLFFIAALPFSVLTSGIGLLEPWLKIKERFEPSNQE